MVPLWRPDVFGEIDLVEEIIRIKGLDKLESISPEKIRLKPTLNFYQRHFHLAQRSVASKGYLEAITWSFTDEKINNKFRENKEEVKIINPISSDLNVLRSSLFPNLINCFTFPLRLFPNLKLLLTKINFGLILFTIIFLIK